MGDSEGAPMTAKEVEEGTAWLREPIGVALAKALAQRDDWLTVRMDGTSAPVVGEKTREFMEERAEASKRPFLGRNPI